MSEPTPVVEATGLGKSFGSGDKGVVVLDGVDLTVGPGEVVALLGPNGAGKTTTIRILATLLRPDAGSATVAGFDVTRDAARVRERISLTGQHAAVDGKLSGAENLAMMGRLAHLPRSSVRSRVDQLLAAFDLVEAGGRRAASYSGGMRRRLDLAAGLLVRPEVMFLDEPTTGLDPRSRQAMWEVIRGVVADGTSVLLTTQYLAEADELADRVSLIDGGRVVAEGTPARLKAQVGDAAVEFSFDTAADAERVGLAIGGSVTDSTVRVPTDGSVEHVRSVLSAVEQIGGTPQQWQVRAPSLDDVFLALTGTARHTSDITENGAAA